MTYDVKKIIEAAIKDIKIDEISIRSTHNPSELILDQSLICDGKYALWGRLDVELLNKRDWKNGDIWLDFDGKEYNHPRGYGQLGNPDIHKYVGYYPIRQENLNVSIALKKIEENRFELNFGGDYSVVLRYEKSEYVRKIVAGGYQGAATMREYCETINEPVIVSYEPLYDVFFGDILVVSHTFLPVDINLANIKFSEDGLSFDYGYSNQCWVSVCIAKDGVCVPQGAPEAEKTNVMRAEDIPTDRSM